MMQKRWLKDFEFHINPATWNAAQEILQAGQVRHLREVERHFWVALVEDEGGNYETEMIITPHKIKAFTCECFAEGRKLMCPHVAASLVKVRQYLEQKAEAKRQKEAEKPSPELGRFTVKTALEHATRETLEAFVREYARRDRDFALALKIWFAGTITESGNPYALLLDSVVPRNFQSKSIREPEYRRLRQTLNNLSLQCSLARNEQNYQTAYQILAAILHNTLLILPKLEEVRRDQILEESRQALTGLSEILQEKTLSPELQHKIWDLLFEAGVKGQFPAELLRESIRTLLESLADSEQLDRIREIFDQTPHPVPPFILHLFLISLAKKDLPQAIVRVLIDYQADTPVIREAILQLYYLQYSDAATAAIEYFRDAKAFPPGQQRELDDILFHIAEKTGDVRRQCEYLRKRYIHTGHPDYLERLKKRSGNKWPRELEILLKALDQANDLYKKAAVLEAEGRNDDLAAMLASSSDFSFLQRYQEQFLPDRKPLIRDNYIDLLSEYLQEHFGRQASAQVRSWLAPLIPKGETGLVQEIIRELITRFEERHTLPEELAELFPPSKRPKTSSAL